MGLLNFFTLGSLTCVSALAHEDSCGGRQRMPSLGTSLPFFLRQFSHWTWTHYFGFSNELPSLQDLSQLSSSGVRSMQSMTMSVRARDPNSGPYVYTLYPVSLSPSPCCAWSHFKNLDYLFCLFLVINGEMGLVVKGVCITFAPMMGS